MQNKGFVKIIAILLTLICVFYLSFKAAGSYFQGKIDNIAATQGQDAADRYQDSLLNEKCYLGVWTLKDCREMAIGLGLDLQGGMNVVLEVSVSDVVMALSDHKELTNENFKKAVDLSQAESVHGGDFIDLFITNYKKLAGENATLAELFATQQLRGKVMANSTDSEVEKVLRTEVDAAIENSHNVLRSRIDQFGVAQPNIQALEGQKGRIMIEMPGENIDPERVRKLLQGSANLEFWETFEATELVAALQQVDSRLAAKMAGKSTEEIEAEEKAETAAADSTETDSVAAPAAAKGDLASAVAGADSTKKDVTKASTEADREKMRREHPLLSMLQLSPSGCVIGMANKLDLDSISALLESPEAKAILPAELSLKWGVKGRGDGPWASIYELYAIHVPRGGHAPLEGDVITNAKDEFDQHGSPCVSMQMNADGARRWAALTKANIKRCVAIVLDNRVYSAPVVQNEITGGNSQITGHFSAQDTRDLSNVLSSGKMPAPAKIVSEEVVGPSLGAESITMGIWSCVIAFVILMCYMVMMYGFIPGMVANGALLLNLFFTVGVLTSFQAALTMSGIAGMVLTLGMAVDANVLIYERTKEEMKAGKKLREALNAGYSNAFSAIFDSNLTSIITGVILFYFGTGPVRGFATTLIIGILVSFFTAVFLTRIVYEGRLAKDKWLNLSFTTALGQKISFQNANFKFMSSYKKSFTIFGAAVVVGLVSMLFLRGFSKSIDFTGGRNFVVVFDKNVSPESVRPVLANAFPESNTTAIALGTDGKTVRISTNYRIEEDGVEVDHEIEVKLYEALKSGGMLAEGLTQETFTDRDNRNGGSIISSQKVGPSVADSITKGAFLAIGLSFVAIFLYILLRFRNLAFSVGAITALIVDILLILGVYSLLWGLVPFSLEIDQTFIGAILTAIGYSINDKVVVFDRIRENISLYPKRDRQRLFNESLNSTLNRTINTSVSTFIVLAVIFTIGLFFKGADSIISFSFAMILGVVFGTFSSIFVAAPTAYLVMGRTIKEEPEEEA